MKKAIDSYKVVLWVIILAGLFLLFVHGTSYLFPLVYDKNILAKENSFIEESYVPEIVHIKTPDAVKAVYMSAWGAGDKKISENIIKMIDDTELNAVIIDVKDYSGKVFFEPKSELIKSYDPYEKRIPDLPGLIKKLHEKNIYVIARISSFQDEHAVQKRPDLAVKKKDGKTVWRDYKGVKWIDPNSREFWDYLIEIGKEAYALGFDELNYDYIRFPSDGKMSDIYFPKSDGLVKADVIESFFNYLKENIKRDSDIPISADLFGMTTTNTDDLSIGQILERAVPYFDYIAPMVYPSHYSKGFMGFDNPAEKPYEVIKYSMEKAVLRASTTPLKFRPWLQDFDLGADYDAQKVRAQINAVYDAGLNSWMLWNASNVYTKEALVSEI